MASPREGQRGLGSRLYRTDGRTDDGQTGAAASQWAWDRTRGQVGLYWAPSVS